MNQEQVCGFFKFGYCKYKDTCRKKHNSEICDNTSCEIRNCLFRHPKTCRYFRDLGRCKFNESCAFKHIESETTSSKRFEILEKKVEEDKKIIDQLTLTQKRIEKDLKERDKEIRKLNETLKKLLEKTETNDSINVLEKEENEFDDLESTFINPFNKIKCDLCDFKAKDERGLKIHERRKHTNPVITVIVEKKKKYTCEECDFETNIKKYFSKHTASSCLLVHFCEFCTESFENKYEIDVHMRTSHTQTTKLKCDKYDFEALTKKFHNEHKASHCLIIVSCDFACGKYFETEEQMTNHMKKVHKW